MFGGFFGGLVHGAAGLPRTEHVHQQEGEGAVLIRQGLAEAPTPLKAGIDLLIEGRQLGLDIILKDQTHGTDQGDAGGEHGLQLGAELRELVGLGAVDLLLLLGKTGGAGEEEPLAPQLGRQLVPVLRLQASFDGLGMKVLGGITVEGHGRALPSKKSTRR